ncbi:hypothetical protein CVT26_002859 [Gymnopilus dilepis]|uniref:F-box domain-containing protein n=1 Tax=Gymnopilus dilepis TaxID=231916 RepID=A0A409VTA4_9AGAR|nr:hypothetical protein CVT26_002859 [Gymnopilus dilepis]
MDGANNNLITKTQFSALNSRSHDHQLHTTSYDAIISSLALILGSSRIMPPKKRQVREGDVRDSRKGQGRPPTQRKLTTEALPAQLLSRIFSAVHSFSTTYEKNTPRRRASPGSVYRLPKDRDPGGFNDSHCCGGETYSKKRIPDEEVPSFSFPLGTVAAVCRRWRDVVHQLPEFFSRIVVYLDKEEPTPLSQIQLYSRKCPADVPLDIVVTRRTFPDKSNEDEREREESLAKAVTKACAPLLPRCRSFIFDVLHTTSLPYISQNFEGHCPHLGVLKLEARIDDEDLNTLPHTADIKSARSFTFPNLFSLALDGYTFMDAIRLPSFKAQMKDLSIDTLSICSFTSPEDNDDGYEDVEDFAMDLSKIGYIRHLTLGVDILADPGKYESGDCEIALDHLTIYGADYEMMEDFSNVTFGSSLCFLHLVDTDITYESLPVVHHLRLERLPEEPNHDPYKYRDPNPAVRFGDAIRRFLGHRLDLIDCQGITDEHLKYIATNCEPLRRLYIANCPKITIKGLKAFISKREEMISEQDEDADEDTSDNSDDELDADDGNDSDAESLFKCDAQSDAVLIEGFLADASPPRGLPYRSFCRLNVSGTGHHLSKTDRRWFQKHVQAFQFD